MSNRKLPSHVESFLTRQHKLLIGGEWVEGGDSAIPVIDPANGETISGITNASQDDVDKAVTAARDAFDSPEWRDRKPQERGRMLHRIADLIEQHTEELAYLETLDNGKPFSIARAVDVGAAAGAFRYYAGWADKIHGQTHNISMPGDFHAYTLREPVGVAALIVPWNYPLVMAAMKLGPALAAGCACILKPAEDTSLSAIRLGELMQEAGVPNGIINIVTGYGHTAGAALAAHEGVDKIAFTGSTATGKAIVAAAAGNLKKVTLELGGKSPCIIMPDADLEQAIPAAAMAVLFNSGQTCTATTRLYAHASVYEQVIAGIVDVAKNVKVGPGFAEDSVLGPLVSAKQLARVESFVARGRDEGDEIVYGGRQIGDTGYFFEPTVVNARSEASTLMREEIFGPVITAQPFNDMGEVIGLANASSYGLSSSVWTQNLSHAHKLAKSLATGQVGINTAAVADWDLPIGGYRQSGWGRENGYDAIANYLQTKAVAISL
ncbi:MAG: aldehyde dehydrogenase family protein [Chromatocurvus sp.]